MRRLGRFVRIVAPIALLVAPVLYALDEPGARIVSILGGICFGIGLSAAYVLLEQIATVLCARKSE